MNKVGQCFLMISTLMVLLMLAVPAVYATPVDLTPYITNPSFESPIVTAGPGHGLPDITGWTRVGTNGGVWYATKPAPGGGNQFAYSNKVGNIYQELPSTVIIQEGATYNLDLYVRNSGASTNLYEVQLYAVDRVTGNDIFLNQISGPLTANVWTTEFLTYTAISSVAGDRLKINLAAPSGGEIDFDNLHLNYEPAPVPVPAALLLFGTGLLGLVGLRRFKKI